MLSHLLFRRIIIISLAIGIYVFLHSGLTLAANGTNANDEGVEVLTRGPLHEAFADVSVNESRPSAIIPRHVPDPINEIPPEFRPAGEKVIWIPGYWNWDDDKDDFIWVSGVWRDFPPDRQWTPGYWVSTGSGSQYISGYWTNTDQAETVYLPPPPSQLAAGPNSPSLAPQQVWMDGHWLWYQNHYAWQPGYWFEPRSDMVWIPTHYVWTPRGYVFVRGYWDYQLSRRGVMFTPVYYTRPIHRNHGYFYTPSIILDFDSVFLSLFVRGDSHHFYYGDYYGPRYEKRGYRPWYSRHTTRYSYNHTYKSFPSRQIHNKSKWQNDSQRQFQNRHKNKGKPTRLYRQQTNHGFKPSQGRRDLPLEKYPSTVRKKADDKPVQFTHRQPDQKRKYHIQDQPASRIQGEQRQHRPLTTQKENSRQFTERAKTVIKTRSSPNITGQHSKYADITMPEKKHYNSHRVKPQLPTKGQTKMRLPKEQHMRQDERTTENRVKRETNTKRDKT